MPPPDMKRAEVSRLAIIGAGDLGFSILRLAKEILHLEPVGFFDDTCQTDTVHSLPVLGGLDSIEALWKIKSFDSVVIAIGYRHMQFRRELYDRLVSLNIRLANIIHPSVILAKDACMGSGSVLFPGCILDVGSLVGNNCILNAGVTIAHDSKIDDHTICGPGVTLAGFTRVQQSCFLGTHTTIIDHINVAPNITTGAGTVVIKNLTEPALYAGVPARKLKPNIN